MRSNLFSKRINRFEKTFLTKYSDIIFVQEKKCLVLKLRNLSAGLKSGDVLLSPRQSRSNLVVYFANTD